MKKEISFEELFEIFEHRICMDYPSAKPDILDFKNNLKDLFAVSKRNLLESILEDMENKHPEYHREVVEDYLDDGC